MQFFILAIFQMIVGFSSLVALINKTLVLSLHFVRLQ